MPGTNRRLQKVCAELIKEVSISGTNRNCVVTLFRTIVKRNLRIFRTTFVT